MKEFVVRDIIRSGADVLDEAIRSPVLIRTLRGNKEGVRREPVVILSESEYKKLKGKK